MPKNIFSYFIFHISYLLFFLSACQSPEQKGERLAKVYCASCHDFPDPSLLDKATWENSILPNMAVRMGFNDPYFTLLRSKSDAELHNIMTGSVFYPEPIVDSTQWEQIRAFYLKNAPEKLPKFIDKQVISPKLKNFEVEKLYFSTEQSPTVTYVGIQPESHDIYVAESIGKIYRIRNNKVVEEIKTNNVVSDIDLSVKPIQVLEMGIMNPNDAKKGSLSIFDKNKISPLLQNLARPVHINKADLNHDGKIDMVVCEHGDYTGQLTWYANNGKGYNKGVLLNGFGGARHTVIKDWNKDGNPDVLAMMGQGREGIFLYLNSGSGQFIEKPLLQFPAVYGSSYFEVVDMNGDGFDDIVYTNGDNSDLSIIAKPYHGVRIFLNDGRGKLKEAYFHFLDGASKVLVEDFDNDGDIDLAVTSYFPDLTKNQRFLFFENQGKGLNFQLSTFAEAPLGKWLVMCSGDIDGDNDKDIILGSYPSPGFWEDPKGVKKLPTVIVLRNNIKK